MFSQGRPQCLADRLRYRSSLWLTPVLCARNPGSHWKRRSHRGGEEDDTEEDLSKDLDDSSTNPTLDEGSGTKNGTPH